MNVSRKRKAPSSNVRTMVVPLKKRRNVPVQLMRTGGNYNQPGFRSAELKYIDVAGALLSDTVAVGAGNAGLTATPTAVLLNGCIQGTDGTTRIGRKISLKKLLFRMNITFQENTTGGTAAGSLAGNVRLLFVYDKQTNGAVPLSTDILLSATVTSPMNLDNRDRFQVIADKVYHVSPVDNAGAYVKLYKKLNRQTIFNAGNAGTVADITTGSLYLFVFSTIATTGGGNIIFTYNSRVRFSDPQ